VPVAASKAKRRSPDVTPTELRVVLDWFTELERLVPTE